MDIRESREINFKENKFTRVVSISDIHFGKLNPEFEYKILDDQFLNKICDLEFDILLIAGDLFHHKELANSDAVKYANLFINRCIEICSKNGATFIIIHGTFEHDANQLKMFYGLAKHSKCDLRIVNSCKFEYVQGLKILCIPEEYGMGEDYYNNLLREEYDMCFCHATYVGAIYGKNKVDLNGRVPVFDIKSFKNCKGPILSGHVHTAACYNKHFYYHGSPIRSQFGEEDDKGFYCTIYDRRSSMYYVHFEKIISSSYNTYNLDDVIDDSIENVIKYIEDHCKGDYVRLVITKNSSNITLLKEYAKSLENIKVETNRSVLKDNLTNNNFSKTLETEYGFIFDKKLNPYDVLAMYINKNETSDDQTKNMTGDDIKKILDKLI